MNDATAGRETTVAILPFGPLTELSTEPLKLTVAFPLRAGELRAELEQAYPALREYRYRIAADRRLLPEEAELHGGEEIALLPPFAGG